MRHVGALAAAAALALGAPGVAAATVEVAVDGTRVEKPVGSYINIRSTVTNTGPDKTAKLVAHLNVASMNDVYVDLEDWTAGPTQSVDPLGPGESTTVSWDVQAVNAGTFDVYAVVLPDGSGPLAVSPPIHVEITGRQTLDPGGALPVALAIPVVLGAVVLFTRRRLRDTA
ncbi:hypothetical protein ABZ816_42445 [Actinosynnema sp. NPDC047251]|uniref:CARDB domain-containing protein n=1 Tax=Saccharothrix espanaensis (strain ATCC 51144 / DSM 44229 / JCM 9112 / NBRC 15066 / NRRL 15764) TaxID=1179773 RepID=K0JXL5_SACES|nr:hypothetical protein [Saccharothrix espanaensis]CCH32615.1 hypothetical protein BN6_53520 [Saccharothrix espanaensis DSM 44229]